eukprot:CAMPEP_0113535676 /NCGR_PEP_ID=MMETSP0015_2-20120614/5846_1 /TAXON_ID=2838 /ORGANISM="Odontella" /LENGTH=114 /DNA_ID=CAMNT_0000434973 /DNA_START=292 /DNA_END=632 /DNA_ORIENTATION=- /assembly_acc=CAM_ASM_000160
MAPDDAILSEDVADGGAIGRRNCGGEDVSSSSSPPSPPPTLHSLLRPAAGGPPASASAVAVAGAGVVREIDWDAVLSRLRSHPEEARRTSRYGWQGSRRRNPLQLAVTSRRGGG